MTFITVTAVLAIIATTAALFWGVVSMARGGTYDKEHSEQLMFTRIGIQTFVFAMLLVAMFLSVV